MDRRAEGVRVYLAKDAAPATVTVEDPSRASREPFFRVFSWLPQPPEYEFEPAVIDQRYHIEIWIEKSTVDDVVRPLARDYGLNVVTGAGDLSLTHCHDFVERVVHSERPARILYASDFDPDGFKMPVGAARKIEFLIRRDHPNLDVQLRPIALTHDQCLQYALPRTPVKDTVGGKAAFAERFGAGATELDALQALHPGELRRILVREIERYYDHDLKDRVADTAAAFGQELADARGEIVRRHRTELNKLRDRQQKLAAECNAKLDPIIKKYERRLRAVADEFNEIQATIQQEMADEALDPDLADWPEPNEGDEVDDALYDSTRDYIEQIDAYREHLGKPNGEQEAAE